MCTHLEFANIKSEFERIRYPICGGLTFNNVQIAEMEVLAKAIKMNLEITINIMKSRLEEVQS